jgi:hypothetical protein
MVNLGVRGSSGGLLPGVLNGLSTVEADSLDELAQPVGAEWRSADCASLKTMASAVSRERSIRPIAIGRKNFLFAGADAGGEILADAMTVIETAKLSDLNPEAYLADILARLRDHDPAKLDDLLPWNWSAQQQATAKAA